MNMKQRGILEAEVDLFMAQIPMLVPPTLAQGKLLTDCIHVLSEMLSGYQDIEGGLRRLDGLAGQAKALNHGECANCGQKKPHQSDKK